MYSIYVNLYVDTYICTCLYVYVYMYLCVCFICKCHCKHRSFSTHDFWLISQGMLFFDSPFFYFMRGPLKMRFDLSYQMGIQIDGLQNTELCATGTPCCRAKEVTHTHTHAHTHAHTYSHTLTLTYVRTLAQRQREIQTHNRSDTQTHRRIEAQTNRGANLQRHRHTDA